MLTQLQLCRAQLLHYPCNGYTATTGYFRLTLAHILSTPNQENFALVLRPLIWMDSYDARKVLSLMGYDTASYRNVVEQGIEIGHPSSSDVDDIITWQGLSYQAYLYLLSREYDVPLWIETDHPDNGKTMIELKLAVDPEVYKHQGTAKPSLSLTEDEQLDRDIETAFLQFERRRLKNTLERIEERIKKDRNETRS